MAAAERWAIGTWGSTRPAALVRIGLAALLWARWADELLPFRQATTDAVVLSLSFFVATTLMFFGCWTTFATAWTTAVVAWMYFVVGLLGGRESWTHHHCYLLLAACGLSVLTASGRSLSIDRWRHVRRAERRGVAPDPERANYWGMRLIACQLSAIYFWSAYSKTTAAFLSGDRLEHYAMWFYFGSDYPSWPVFHAAMQSMAVGTVILEYALAVGLLVRSARQWLFVPGLLLHALFYLALPVSTFSATMCLLYLAYCDPNTVDEVIARLLGTPDRRRD